MTAEAVLKTIAYFDLFEYPLGTFEVWKWLWGDAADLRSVTETLQQLAEQKKIEQHDGCWFLVGRSSVVTTRHERHRLSISKMRRAKRFARLFAFVPWVEGIAVCNSLGYRNASAGSDIDFFIITKSQAIWVTRALTTLATAFLGARPTEAHGADTACLSFYVSHEAMNLESLLLPGGDPYFAYWLTTLTPLFGRGEVWQAFWEANIWVKRAIPNAMPYQSHSPFFYRTGHTWSLGLPAFAERLARRLQEKRFPAALREQASLPATNVVASGSMLKFHMNDRRALYRRRWEEKYATVA